MNTFFLWLNTLDTFSFNAFLPFLVWLGWGWRRGARLGWILLIDSILVHTLKTLFAVPRPHDGMILLTSYSWPSGAAANAMLLSSLLLSYKRTPWTLSFVLLYLPLLSYSRLYLHVHFPSDILGGWVVGYSLFVIYKRLFDEPPLEYYFARCSR